MIKNKKQLTGTLRNISLFTEKLSKISDSPEKKSITHLIEEMQKEVDLYLDVKNGTKKTFSIDSLENISDVIINSRISRGLSQKDLADIVGTTQQQINRWENTDFEKTSFWHILDVCEALEIKFKILANLLSEKELKDDREEFIEIISDQKHRNVTFIEDLYTNSNPVLNFGYGDRSLIEVSNDCDPELDCLYANSNY